MSFEQLPGSSISDRSLRPKDMVVFGLQSMSFDTEDRVTQIIEVGTNGDGVEITITSTFTYPQAGTTVITSVESGGSEPDVTTTTTIVEDGDGNITTSIS